MKDDIPEFALACACCAWPLAEGRLQAIRAAAGKIADWDRFQRVAERHRIAGLVHNALGRAGVDVPEPVKGFLASRAREIARQNLLMASEAIRLQRLLDENGIAVKFVKGSALAVRAYGSLSLKHAVDIDLLVMPEDARRAYAILEEARYEAANGRLDERQRRALFGGANEAGLIHTGNGLKIELHWALTENPLLLRGVNARTPGGEVEVSPGQNIRTLGDGELFAYLCVHGAYHAWMRLKWLADFNAFIAAIPDCDLERLYRRAAGMGSGPSAAQALLLAHDLLGLDLPAVFEAQLRRPKRNRILLNVARKPLTGDDCEKEIAELPFGTARISLSHFLLGQGWRYVLTQIRTVLFMPRDVIDYPLPSWLIFAYPVLRVPLYVWRLMIHRGRGAPSYSARKT